jgi:hypothetical protein
MKAKQYAIRSPGIRTGDVIEKIVEGDRQELKRENISQWCQEQDAKCPVYNPREGVDYSNIMQQMGQPMSASEVERRLQRINANLRFETNWRDATKKACYYLQGDTKEFICAYENGTMPEHSIMRVVEEEIPDPDFFLGRTPIERDKLPAHEKVEDPDSPLGFSYEFDPTSKRQGFKYQLKGFGEDRRGWRTLLLRLIVRKLITVEQAERMFSPDFRPEWAVHTGKRRAADVQASW